MHLALKKAVVGLAAFLAVTIPCMAQQKAVEQQQGPPALRPGELRDTLLRDTFFLSRYKAPEIYNAVYIDKGRSSVAYHRLTDFRLSADDRKTLQSNYAAALSDTPAYLSQCLPVPQKLLGIPQEWLPLHKYKGQYYLYEPCDEGAIHRQIIRPTMLVRWYADGPSPQLLESITQPEPGMYWIVTYVCGPEGKDPTVTIIHLIDAQRQLAVWEYPGKENGYSYELMVSKAGAKYFDAIVNRCDGARAGEYDFETIDFAALLAEKAKKNK